jgi:hypothetical protein
VGPIDVFDAAHLEKASARQPVECLQRSTHLRPARRARIARRVSSEPKVDEDPNERNVVGKPVDQDVRLASAQLGRHAHSAHETVHRGVPVDRARYPALWGTPCHPSCDGHGARVPVHLAYLWSVGNLGEVIGELRAINEPVPRPLGLPTEAEVRDVEQRSGVRFHDDLRRYLLEASGVVFGTTEPVTIGGGHTEIGAVISRARDLGVRDDLVPICENGDIYCMAETGEVVFWSHDGTTDGSWPDLATWITEVWIGGN